VLISKVVCLFKEYSNTHEICRSQQSFCTGSELEAFHVLFSNLAYYGNKSYLNIFCWGSSIGLLPCPYRHKVCAHLLLWPCSETYLAGWFIAMAWRSWIANNKATAIAFHYLLIMNLLIIKFKHSETMTVGFYMTSHVIPHNSDKIRFRNNTFFCLSYSWKWKYSAVVCIQVFHKYTRKS